MEKRKNLSFKSDFEGVNVCYDIYIPDSNNDKHIILQVLHGMSEHKDRYEGFGTYLANHGITTVVSSHRGHSPTASKKDYGYMGSDGLNQAMEDNHKLTQIIKEEFKDYQFCLMGHSMGSLIVRLYLQKYEDEIGKLIVCGTPSNNSAIDGGIMLTKMIRAIYGPHHISKFIDKLLFGGFNKPFAYRTGFEWLSVNEQNVDDYVKDEACGFAFSVQSYLDLMRGLKQVYSPYPNVKNKELPIMFISGDEDPCGEFGKGVKDAYEHIKSQGYNNVTLKLYPKLRHEILNEECKETIFDDIIKFIA